MRTRGRVERAEEDDGRCEPVTEASGKGRPPTWPSLILVLSILAVLGAVISAYNAWSKTSSLHIKLEQLAAQVNCALWLAAWLSIVRLLS